MPMQFDCSCNRCGWKWRVCYGDEEWDRQLECGVRADVTRCPNCGSLDIRTGVRETEQC